MDAWLPLNPIVCFRLHMNRVGRPETCQWTKSCPGQNDAGLQCQQVVTFIHPQVLGLIMASLVPLLSTDCSRCVSILCVSIFLRRCHSHSNNKCSSGGMILFTNATIVWLWIAPSSCLQPVCVKLAVDSFFFYYFHYRSPVNQHACSLESCWSCGLVCRPPDGMSSLP